MNKAQPHPLTGMPAELWISTDGVYIYPSTGKSSHGNERYVRGDIAAESLKLKALLAEVGNIANSIRAADGAPRGYSHEYFSQLVDRIHEACDGDCLRYSWKEQPSRDRVNNA